MDSEVELQLRHLIFQRLAEIVAEHGVVTRPALEALQVGNETRRIIDRNRGIWNPQSMLATLSVVSNPSGPYADVDVGDSLLAYDYRAGSTDGDNKKMRRAYELGLPIILLRTIRPGVFVPVFPVYVVKDDIDNRQFVLALDESLRFVSDPLHLRPIERESTRFAQSDSGFISRSFAVESCWPTTKAAPSAHSSMGAFSMRHT